MRCSVGSNMHTVKCDITKYEASYNFASFDLRMKALKRSNQSTLLDAHTTFQIPRTVVREQSQRE